jgi:hypothetical protein
MATKKINEFAIPILPCNSINPTLEFYQALGFTITYQQKAPNTYVCLKIRTIELHFFALKQLQPEANFSTCYLIVQNIDALYESFTQGLKKQFGKIPVKGIPRINPLKDMPTYGVRQFIVVDPSGNYIRIGQPIEQKDSLIFKENNKSREANFSSPVEEALELSERLVEGKDDLVAAAKVLDKALKTTKPTDHQLLKMLVLRADIAERADDLKAFKEFLKQARLALKTIDPKIAKEEIRLLKEIESR